MSGGPAEAEPDEQLVVQTVLLCSCCSLAPQRDCAGDGRVKELWVASREARGERTKGRAPAWKEQDQRRRGTMTDDVVVTLRDTGHARSAAKPICCLPARALRVLFATGTYCTRPLFQQGPRVSTHCYQLPAHNTLVKPVQGVDYLCVSVSMSICVISPL